MHITVFTRNIGPNNYNNQAYTCKTLGVVTKPKSIASTHAQMHPRNIIHARAQYSASCILATTPSALKALGVVASIKLACTSHVAPRFLTLEPVSFSTTAAYSFVFAVDHLYLSIRKLSAGALYHHKDGLG